MSFMHNETREVTLISVKWFCTNYDIQISLIIDGRVQTMDGVRLGLWMLQKKKLSQELKRFDKRISVTSLKNLYAPLIRFYHKNFLTVLS